MNANGIALIVEEPAPGQFFWVLQQHQQRRRRAAADSAIERAARPMPSYGLAVMAGITALEQHTGIALGRCGTTGALRATDRPAVDFGPTTIAGTL